MLRRLDKRLEKLAQSIENGDSATMVELRTKLEMRTLLLRFSIALNTGLFAGIITGILIKYVLP